MVELSATAERLGAVDVFVLQRVSDGQFVNLAGAGRGAGWAGNITLDPTADPWLAEGRGQGSPSRHRGDIRRLFGPFWSTEAVLANVGEFAVVFSGPGVADLDDETVMDEAGQIAWSVGEVPTEKRLADELELSQAALAVASISGESRVDVARTLAGHAAELLSCEFAAVVLADEPPTLVTAPEGWRPDADDEAIVEAIAGFAAERDGSRPVLVDQEVAASPKARRPLALDDGLVARCLVPLGDDGDVGWLFCAHTVEQPRGFTSLCQRVAEAIGDHGTQVLARAA